MPRERELRMSPRGSQSMGILCTVTGHSSFHLRITERYLLSLVCFCAKAFDGSGKVNGRREEDSGALTFPFSRRTENAIMTAVAAIKTCRDVKRVLAPVYMPPLLIGNINRAVSKATFRAHRVGAHSR